MHARTLIVCLLASWSASADTSTPPASEGSVYLMATLERTACYGTCPIYKLSVWSDGRVEWIGEGFVKVRDKVTARLSAPEVQALRDAFSAAKYFELEGNFACYEMTDHPSANTSYNDGTRKKAIPHYHGCLSNKQGPGLILLENRIDSIVKTNRWVGTEKERRPPDRQRK